MLIDGLPYAEYATLNGTDTRLKTLRAFVKFFADKLGASVVYKYRDFPFERPDLQEALTFAGMLREHGIITDLYKITSLPDEPPLKLWGAVCNNAGKSHVGGGSLLSDDAALRAVVGEALERYLWFTQRDYFRKPRKATVAQIGRHGRCVALERFVSFSQTQRDQRADLKLRGDDSYLWIQGDSLVNNSKVYIPAQVASGAIHVAHGTDREPLVRQQTTIGLATWPTRIGAQLAGALECIEREAYMIMWFNQLSLPRLALDTMRAKHKTLDSLLTMCERYRLKAHAIRMITDAPTHAICAVVEDTSGHAPRFMLGLKAHRSLQHAVEGSILEALRARRSYRSRARESDAWDPNTPLEKIGHHERTFYWARPENASRLEFLIRGKETDAESAEWEKDSIEAHAARIIGWCRSHSFEYISVPLGISAANPLPWHVEMVIMPDLHPTHLHESFQHLGGKRWKTIPQQYGYKPLERPFIEAPHPFC
ncbi:hypothetical protein C4568_04310 [Candidatus Parcubacteria bacterium]|nr:MAG: hypothetical protein C4568_04310 [Candidatus Parcubacteria bacterium]